MSKERDVLVLSRAETVRVLVIETMLETVNGRSLLRRGIDFDSPVVCWG